MYIDEPIFCSNCGKYIDKLFIDICTGEEKKDLFLEADGEINFFCCEVCKNFFAEKLKDRLKFEAELEFINRIRQENIQVNK